MTDLRKASDVVQAIRRYAVAYGRLQSLQESSGLIPAGDQKTGAIGEFFVFLYLSGKYSGEPIRYAGHSNKGWDIEIGTPGNVRRIQTKTVSAYSTTRRLSPICGGWDQLFIVYLGKDLLPEGFWIVMDPRIVPDRGVLRHCSSPHPEGRRHGTAAIPFGANRIDEFKSILQRFVSLDGSK